jgi:uncharacterized protein YecT (DUF1311 family)
MRRLLLSALATAMILPVAVQAEEMKDVDAAVVEACFAGAAVGDVLPSCIGAAAKACEAQTPATTLDISECLMAETAVWDAILNREYKAARAALARQGAADGGNVGTLTDGLRDAQRAWIAFRDADCGLTYSIWAGGSIRVIFAGNCYLTKTAQRAIELRDIKGE